jgi:hypothetical protein
VREDRLNFILGQKGAQKSENWKKAIFRIFLEFFAVEHFCQSRAV